MPQFSVIIPVYKGKRYLPNLIHMLEMNWNSINEKESAEIEAIFINDYPEEPLEIKKEWVTNLSLKVIENVQNKGIHFSRVQGFCHSKGEYILFLDQDDEISPVYLREQLKEISHYDAMISNGKNYSNLIYRNETELNRAIDEKEYRKGYNRIVAPGQVLLRREIFPSEWLCHILQNNGADDFFLWLIMFQKNCRFGVHDKVLYWHFLSDENTSNDIRKMYRSVCEVTEKMEKLDFLTREDSDAIRKVQSVPLRKKESFQAEYEKEKHYRKLLELWMELQDKKISVAGFLCKRQIQKVAIYGGGALGKHLYYELKGTSVYVECILDRNSNVKIEGIETILPGERMKLADAIIITPFWEYKQIKKELEKSYPYRILSIETLLYNADFELKTE